MAITFTWNGSSVAATRSSGAVWTVRDYEFGSFEVQPRVQRLDFLHGEWETYQPLPKPSLSWRLAIQADVTGITGTDAEGELLDGWAEAAEFFNPLDGVGWLGVSRPDASGATVSRRLRASVLSVPQFRIQAFDPKGIGGSGAYPVSGAPYIVYVVGGDTRFPYWVRSTLLSTDTGAAAAELAVGASPDTVTINNPGVRWAGCKLVVKAGSVSGTVTGFTVENTTNGDTMVLTRGSAFAAGEYLDWFATDPLEIDKDSDWRYGGAGDKLRLEPGDNTLEVTRTAGSGTLTLELSWPALFLTM